MNDITICMVNFNLDNILQEQIDFLSVRNNDIRIKIIVVNNTPFKYTGKLTNNCSLDIVPGVPMSQALRTHKNLGDKTQIGKPKGGNQHGIALTNAVNLVETQYVIVMDPDCFVFYPLSKLIDYMSHQKLAIVSTTYGHNNNHTDASKHTLPKFCDAPSPFFTLINKEIWTDKLSWDPRDWDDEFAITDNIETGMRIRTSYFKFKNKILTICTNTNCSICKQLKLPISNIQKKSVLIERFFLDEYFFAVHLHYRHSDMSEVRQLKQLPFNIKINHPNPCFIK